MRKKTSKGSVLDMQVLSREYENGRKAYQP